MTDPSIITFLFFFGVVLAAMAAATFALALYWLKKARRIYLEAQRGVWRAEVQRIEREHRERL